MIRKLRSLPGLAIASLVVVSTMAGGCANAKAQAALPDSAPLMIPQAPSRVVVPPAPDPPPVVVETPAPTASSTTANPPANGNRPNRDPKPQPPPPTNPPATAAASQPAQTAPTTPLETQGNQNELDQKARSLILSANATLSKINERALSADGKAQYDAAQRFISQANEALKVKNVVYAWQLADKANTIATLLLRHS